MGLREIAANDSKLILEDSTTGFGWPITVTTPDESSDDFTGFSNDISAVIDPDTGQIVGGQQATVALSIEALNDVGFEIPRNISSSDKKPWLIKFENLLGVERTFKVRQSLPDNGLGVVVCVLEDYKPA